MGRLPSEISQNSENLHKNSANFARNSGKFEKKKSGKYLLSIKYIDAVKFLVSSDRPSRPVRIGDVDDF